MLEESDEVSEETSEESDEVSEETSEESDEEPEDSLSELSTTVTFKTAFSPAEKTKVMS